MNFKLHNLENFEYFDFGCSDGATMVYMSKIFPLARGLGIDTDKLKIDKAIDNGHEAIVFNILELPEKKIVSFVTMSHFLEHLPSVRDAEKMITKAISASEDFVFIRQPWFDSDGPLLTLGAKYYWSDWRAHINKMTTLDFFRILENELCSKRILGYQVFGSIKVQTTADPAIIPLLSPVNSFKCDLATHGVKTAVRFSFPCFREIVILINVGGIEKQKVVLDNLDRLQLVFSRDHEQMK